jgi:ribonuclease HII
MNDKLIEKYETMNMFETKYKELGFLRICGVDEVGRGPLAGPVTIAACILLEPIYGLDDSKKLSFKRIEELSYEIKQKALAYSITSVSVSSIEKYGIKGAVHLGMQRVVKNVEADFALIDFEKPKLKIPSDSFTKGDSRSNSIAASSILAKFHRDSYMIKLGKKNPEYGFETHVGYGTKKHIEAIEKYGIIDKVHRKNFKPVSTMLGENL